jgi:hypothetical protein
VLLNLLIALNLIDAPPLPFAACLNNGGIRAPPVFTACQRYGYALMQFLFAMEYMENSSHNLFFCCLFMAKNYV